MRAQTHLYSHKDFVKAKVLAKVVTEKSPELIAKFLNELARDVDGDERRVFSLAVATKLIPQARELCRVLGECLKMVDHPVLGGLLVKK